MAMNQEEYQKRLQDPADHYSSPDRVVADAHLSYEQKKAVLEAWKQDEKELLTAAEENMAGGEQGCYQEVVQALESLKKDSSDS